MSLTHDDLVTKFVEMQEQIRVLQETVNKLISNKMTRTESENSGTSDISVLSELNDILVFEFYKKAIKVSGNTLPYREKLRAKGGSWNRTLSAWIFSQKKGIQLAMKMKERYPDKVSVSDEINAKSGECDSTD
jgi:hypothetical protein